MGQQRSRLARGVMMATGALLFSAAIKAGEINSGPDCSAITDWPAQITQVRLNESGVAFPASTKITSTLVASMKMNEKQRRDLQRARILDKQTLAMVGALYRQVYRITLLPPDSKAHIFITTTLASDEECSVALLSIAEIAQELTN
ncbi:hypothetical protein [Siccibacter turicensis]|uniref:hypothetical protein n=1 Tax=Siccibacter turicensis TaxID=357233 RepID=UPI000466ED83|nr:hypothetical protein [Siccibacter turicensis]